ncbi:cellulase (glycosyl hydrolase family 5) [Propionicimonas paludicola]|uniref:Cellulase (Glycosyl hydrolase family 5) n=1 Tax=Propionicimonas paludicola TaxID=185243 RepID=A0A2A9CXU0_9ACTN|nr:cellulase family glycosylhydrolase [Propionicimonas paludicola]PFG18389.1 cellulase (glycosyl hydrolase family 5) [Propionicimonas paludicola]
MTGYLRSAGGALVDDDGPRRLRGIGLGNWLVPEGYMWGLPATSTSPRQIEGLVAAVLGSDRAAQFWDRWRREYVSELDLAEIARAGFDHVRLPLSWRLLCTVDGTLIEDGFVHLDRFLDSCALHGLGVVLDLHAAPGGQTGTNIDDSAGLPELFFDPHWRRLTVRLWRAIAERYAQSTTVLAYDLLNEPLPYHWADDFGDELMSLYQDLTAAVREVDPNHLLMYEGTRWATDFSGFTGRLDDNSALQFHKYWSRPDQASLGHFLEVAGRLDLPLYMGEGGENTLDWNAAAVALYERLGISWCTWPYKTIGRSTSLCAILPPTGWTAFTGFESGRSSAADRARAAQALAELEDRLLTRPEQLNRALFGTLMRKPPLRLPAPAFAQASPGVEVRWPEDFDFSGGQDPDTALAAVVELPAGGLVEYALSAPAGDVTAVVADGEVRIEVVERATDDYRVRVSADRPASLQAVVITA